MASFSIFACLAFTWAPWYPPSGFSPRSLPGGWKERREQLFNKLKFWHKEGMPSYFSFFIIWVTVMPADTCDCPWCQGGFASPWLLEPGVCAEPMVVLPILQCGKRGDAPRKATLDLGTGWDLRENVEGAPSNVGADFQPFLSPPAGCHWATLLPCQDLPWRADGENVFLLLPR